MHRFFLRLLLQWSYIVNDYLDVSRVTPNRWLQLFKRSLRLLTAHPNAHLRKSWTSDERGAEPLMMNFTLPPSDCCTRPNTSLSQMVSRRTIPLKCHGVHIIADVIAYAMHMQYVREQCMHMQYVHMTDRLMTK